MPDKNAEQLLAQLDNIGLDAYTLRAMEQAVEIEELINDDSEPDELTQITIGDLSKEAVEKMDAECPHMGEPVLVTGLLKQAYYDDLEETFKLEDVHVDRAVLISYGYTILEFGNNETGKPVKRVGNLFLREQMEPRNDTPPLVDYVPRMFAFAPVGQVNIEFNDDNQDNDAELQKLIPELLEEIDERLLNADDECSALLSLADMTIDASQDIPGSVLSALLGYVNRKLGFDKSLPYSALISGLCYNEKPDQYGVTNFVLYRHNDDTEGCIVSPDTLSLRRYPTLLDDGTIEVTDGELCWCVDVVLHDGDAEAPKILLSIPVKNLEKFQSFRRMIFRDRDTVQ